MSSIIKVDTIQDSGGNQILTSDGSGVITGNLSARPAFSMSINSQLSLSNATETKVQFDKTIFDTDSAWDSTNYRFTPQVAGKYYFFFMATPKSGGNSTLSDLRFKINKNSTTVARVNGSYDNNPVAQENGTATVMIDMNGSTDYVEFYIYVNISSGTTAILEDPYTVAGGYKLPGV